MNRRGLLAVSDRRKGRGAETALLSGYEEYVFDADTDGNPGVVTRHVLDIGVSVTINILQMVE